MMNLRKILLAHLCPLFFFGQALAGGERFIPLRANKTAADGAGFRIERQNEKGAVAENITVLRDRLYIEKDHYGDGIVDTWEYHSALGRIKMLAPAGGQFQLMEVEYFAAGKFIKWVFERVSATEFEPILALPMANSGSGPNGAGVFFEEANIGVGTKAGAEAQPTGAIDVSQRVKAARDQKLESSVKNVMSQGRCQKDGKMGLAIESGIKQVVSESGVKACLQKHGFDSAADFMGTRFSDVVAGSWTVSCDVCGTNSKLCSGGEEKSGAYQPKNDKGRPEITFLRAANCGSGKCAANETAIGQTFLHEMLHAAGVTNEAHAQSIAGCCAPQQPNPNACVKVSSIEQGEARRETYLAEYENRSAGQKKFVNEKLAAIAPGKNASGVVVDYLTSLSSDHQSVVEQNKLGACADETQAECQALLKKVTTKTFEEKIASLCAKPKTQECSQATTVLAGQLNIDTSQTSQNLQQGVFPRRPKSFHQIPTGQMAQGAGDAGQAAGLNLPPSGGSAKAHPYQGPKISGTVGAGSADAAYRGSRAVGAQTDLEASLSYQNSVVDALFARVAKLAASTFGPQSASQNRVTDPSMRTRQGVGGLSSRVKKLITHNPNKPSEATGAKKPNDTQVRAIVPPEARERLVQNLTALRSDKLSGELDRPEVQKLLADCEIGVIDSAGARHDKTPSPKQWLIFNEETGRLQMVDTQEAQ
jgi:hypothetical protein